MLILVLEYKLWWGEDVDGVYTIKGGHRLGGQRGKFWLPDQLELVDLGFSIPSLYINLLVSFQYS